MDCQIIRTLASRRDLRGIARFIARDNPEAALRLGDEIFRKVEMLRTFPEMGRPVPERAHPAIREIILSPFRIVYRFNTGQRSVEVLRVWRGARGEPSI
jgi:toxin ParE1/3/4